MSVYLIVVLAVKDAKFPVVLNRMVAIDVNFPQITRYRIYIACMTSTSIEDLQTPIPSSLVPSPSISTLATVNVDDCTFEPPSPTLSTHSHLGFKQHKKNRKRH